MSQRRTMVWLWPVLSIPFLLCGCCVWAFFAPAIPAVAGHLPLIFGGSHADGTISAIDSCTTEVRLSAGATGGLSWSFGQEATADARLLHITYLDAHGQTRAGQTVLCVTLPADATVGAPIALIYHDSNPADVVLARDQSVYQQFATSFGVLLGILLGYVLVVALMRASARRRAAAPGGMTLSPTAASAFDAPGGVAPWGSMNANQMRFKALSDQVIGPNTYPTPALGLKEALMLMHLRQVAPTMPDEPDVRGNAHPLRDHLVVAAMLLDLVRQGRITIEGGERMFARPFIVVRDGSPLADPELNALLTALQTARDGRVRLGSFYRSYGQSPLAARLIDQLRKGGYVRLYVPETGRFSVERTPSNNPLAQAAGQFFGKVGFRTGAVVTTDDYRLALPWQFLYTTHTPAEERIFAQSQAAITSGGATDDFTQGLLGLISAHYISWAYFPRMYRGAKSILRFYPADERRDIYKRMTQIARQSPYPWQAIIRIARVTDEQIENPPSSS